MTIDRHYTQPQVARACVDRLVKYGDFSTGFSVKILDPCVGKGAFPSAFRELLPSYGPFEICTIDLDTGVEADYHRDFLRWDAPDPPGGGRWDLIVSNPPFSLAQAFVERSLALVSQEGTVAFLLLLQFLGSVIRTKFFEEFPPSTVDVLRPRPSFSSDGSTDMREYALFRWRKHEFLGNRLGWIDWSAPKARRKSSRKPRENSK